jgi:hypothetical protein
MSRRAKKFIPIKFIGEEIDTTFEKSPMYSKKPGSPSAFTWREEEFNVKDTLSTWFDYGRKGKAAKNMREENLREATRRGSWGVGRYYFRVETERGRIFDIYYDRAPKDASDRVGHWFLWREMEEQSKGGQER